MKRRNSRERRSSLIEEKAFERETTVLGFSPVKVVDSIINAANDYTADGVDALEDALIHLIPNQRANITFASDKLLDLISPLLDRYCDKFELYVLNNSFRIPTEFQEPVANRFIEPNNLSRNLHSLQTEEHRIDLELHKLIKSCYEIEVEVKMINDRIRHLERSDISESSRPEQEQMMESPTHTSPDQMIQIEYHDDPENHLISQSTAIDNNEETHRNANGQISISSSDSTTDHKLPPIPFIAGLGPPSGQPMAPSLRPLSSRCDGAIAAANELRDVINSCLSAYSSCASSQEILHAIIAASQVSSESLEAAFARQTEDLSLDADAISDLQHEL